MVHRNYLVFFIFQNSGLDSKYMSIFETDPLLLITLNVLSECRAKFSVGEKLNRRLTNCDFVSRQSMTLAVSHLIQWFSHEWKRLFSAEKPS